MTEDIVERKAAVKCRRLPFATILIEEEPGIYVPRINLALGAGDLAQYK
jgi:hypothetical protein